MKIANLVFALLLLLPLPLPLNSGSGNRSARRQNELRYLQESSLKGVQINIRFTLTAHSIFNCLLHTFVCQYLHTHIYDPNVHFEMVMWSLPN